MYVNNKTNFSNMNGLLSHQQLIDFACINELPAIGICDQESFDGCINFTKLALAQGVKPILGVDTFVMYNQRIEDVLLICTGEQSRYEINKALSNNDPVDYEQLMATIVVFKNENITEIMDKDYRGLTANNISNVESIESNHLLIDDIYLNSAADLELFSVIRAVEEKKKKSEVNVSSYGNKHLKVYPRTNQSYDKLYTNYLQLLPKIEDINIDGTFKLPIFKNEKSTNNCQYLTELANAGLNKRLKTHVPTDYQLRLNYELEVIANLQYVDYFLIVWDIIKYCRLNGIYYGPGRGSSAGSLVAYCLGITSIDPLANGLLFERFLNPERKSMPDIDIDFDSEQRDLVFDYMFEKYGADFTCRIKTYALYKGKSSFEAIAKATGISDKTIKTVSKFIDPLKTFADNMSENSSLRDSMLFDSQLSYTIDYINYIENTVKNASIHAAGVIITSKPIYHYTAVHKGISANNASELEKIGLVKFDILAVTVLTTIRKIEEKIELDFQQKIDFKQIPLDDKIVFEKIALGLNCGIFQLEQPYARTALINIKPNTFSEFADILALIRPGANAHIEMYAQNKHQTRYTPNLEPSINRILETTHGVMLYQEQVMEIVQTLGNYSLAEADNFRRAISKKDEALLETEITAFKQRAIVNNYQEQFIDQICELIAAFGEYGFNKAHAYSYAMISYALFYYKVHYPAQFYTTIISQGISEGELNLIKNELKYLDIEIMNPNLKNISAHGVVAANKFYLGIASVKGISEKDAKAICAFVANNQQLEIIEMIEYLLLELKLRSDVVKNLVGSGLFASGEYNEKTLNVFIDEFDTSQDLVARNFFKVESRVIVVENYSLSELEDLEHASININIRYNTYQTLFNQCKINYPQLTVYHEQFLNNNYFTFATLVKLKQKREIVDKNGAKMAFIDATIEGVDLSFVAFSNVYDKFYDLLVDLDSYALVMLKVSKQKLVLENIKKI